MASFYKLSLEQNLITSFISGFRERYDKYFPDFSNITIILPNSFALIELQKQMQSSYKHKQFIMPELYTPTSLSANSSDLSKLDLDERASIFNFLLSKKEDTKSQAGLFDNDYFKNLETKHLTSLATDILNLKINTITESHNQESGYKKLLNDLIQEYQTSTFRSNISEQHNKNSLHKLIGIKYHIICLTIPSSNHLETKVTNLLTTLEHQKVDIIYPNLQDFTDPIESIEPWREKEDHVTSNSEMINLKAKNISYHDANNEAEEIEVIFALVLRNLKKQVKTNIICYDYKFALSLKNKFLHYFPKTKKQPSPNTLLFNIIELLTKEIAVKQFNDRVCQLYQISDFTITGTTKTNINIFNNRENYTLFDMFNIIEELLNHIQEASFSQETLSFMKLLHKDNIKNFTLAKKDLKPLMIFLFKKNDDFGSYQPGFMIAGLSQAYCTSAEEVIITNFKQSYYSENGDSNNEYTSFLCKFILLLSNKNLTFTWNKGDKNKKSNILYEILNEEIKQKGITYTLPSQATKPNNVINYVTPPKHTRIHNLSITQIEKLLRNPYALYADKILHLKPKPSDNDAIAFIQYGNALHYAIQQFTRNYSILKERGYEKYLVNEFSKFLDRKDITELKFLFIEKFKSSIPEIISLENTIRNTYSDYFPETRLEHEMSDISNIKIFGYIDRLNLTQTQYQVIDYKTGVMPTFTQISSGLNGQILLASFLVQKKFKIRNGDACYLKFSDNNVIKKEIEYDNELEDKLLTLLKKYQNQETKLYIIPDKNLNYFNEYKHLCRE